MLGDQRGAHAGYQPSTPASWHDLKSLTMRQFLSVLSVSHEIITPLCSTCQNECHRSLMMTMSNLLPMIFQVSLRQAPPPVLPGIKAGTDVGKESCVLADGRRSRPPQASGWAPHHTWSCPSHLPRRPTAPRRSSGRLPAPPRKPATRDPIGFPINGHAAMVFSMIKGVSIDLTHLIHDIDFASLDRSIPTTPRNQRNIR